jgi:hypothetical protein
MRELADMFTGETKPPSVFGEGREAGRMAGILADAALFIMSERIQLGKALSSIGPSKE